MDALLAKARKLQKNMDIQGSIQDRKYKLKVYKQWYVIITLSQSSQTLFNAISSFLGTEAVAIMILLKIVDDIHSAVQFGNTLIEFNIIAHVTQEHTFKNEAYFYHFTMDLSDIPKLTYTPLSQISNYSCSTPIFSPQTPTSPNKERVTMSQLTFRLETEFSSLSTNINICETLLNIKSIADIDSKKTSHSSTGSITVTKQYLTQIQSAIHKYHYRIESLSKKQQQIADQNDYDEDVMQILDKVSAQIKRIEDMFFAINSAFIKQTDPDDQSQRILQKRKSTESKYGKVIKDGFLTKLGHVRKSWKLRLFILTQDGYLRYYDNKQRLLNEVDLSQCQFVSVETPNRHFNKPFVYVVYLSFFPLR